MPNTREKLIELIGQAQDCGCDVTDVVEMNYVENDVLADHLIANGVTAQKWIPVTERLPDLHTKVLCCGIKGGRFIAELFTWGKEEHLCWDKRDGKGCPTVTHWMPLPEAPKGE